jgi:iron complex outermembrane recepter protein
MNRMNMRGSLSRAALIVGAAWGLAGSGIAFAQDAAPEPAADEAEATGDIVVTGTLIRGIETPTGANLLNITRESIVSTGTTAAKDLLNQTVPQLSTFNALPTGSVDFGSAVNKISLRGIGTSAGLSSGTNATLVLLNGHRIVPVGILSTDADPDLIPAEIIQSVQVLPDGGSATYGSDAIGGVVNFVTRKRFDGLQLRYQHVFGSDYNEDTAAATLGKSWSTGTAFVSVTYNKHDAIFGRDRDYITADFSDRGGVDRRNTACEFGAFTVDGQLYSANGFTPIASPPRCDQTDWTNLVPEEKRWNVFGYIEQELGENLKFAVDGFWSDRRAKIYSDIGYISAGTRTITAANPAFRPVGTETSQSVSVNYARALGNYRVSPHEYNQWQIAPSLTWSVNDDWQVRGEFIHGESESIIHDRSGVNGAALTATNFNPYDPALTSPSVIAALADYELYSRGVNKLTSGTVTATGKLFSLPGGDVQLAFGGEIRRQSLLDQTVTGPIGNRAGLLSFDSDRTVKALFAELQAPVVGPDNAMPGIAELSLNAAVRYDHYSDFGGTTNPRIGFDYRPVEDLVIRANYQTTFVAPSLADSGNLIDTRFQITPRTGVPGTGYLVFIAGAGQNLDPQTGRTFSIGAEWAPKGSGFRIGASYWNTRLENIISQALAAYGSSQAASTTAFNLCGVGGGTWSPSSSGACTLPYLESLQPIYRRIDNGATPSIQQLSDLFQPGVTLIGVIDARRNNFGNAKLDGIDFNASYQSNVPFGSVFAQIAGTYNLTKKIANVPGRPYVDYLEGTATIQGSPRLNLVASLGGTSGPVTLRGNLRHNSGYDIPANLSPGQTRVGSFTVIDFYAGLALDEWTGLEGTRLDVTVNNVFDQDPPFYGAAGNANRTWGYANGGTLGRTVSVGLTAKF